MPEEIKDGQEEEVLQEQPQSEEPLEELSTSEEPTEEAQEEELELPDEAKERTKEQFEKLKANNAELKRQLEEQSKLPSVLDYPGMEVPQISPDVRQQYMQPPQVNMPVFNQPYQQPAPTPAPQLVDEQGYVNAGVLEQQLRQAELASKRAEEAERRAIEAQQKIAKFEQDSETKELYKQYPELDPLGDSFNKEAYDLVRNELTSQIVNTGKRDALQAAERMSKYFRTKQPTNQKVLEQRKQVSTVSGSQPRQVGNTDISKMSTAERLKRLGL